MLLALSLPKYEVLNTNDVSGGTSVQSVCGMAGNPLKDCITGSTCDVILPRDLFRAPSSR